MSIFDQIGKSTAKINNATAKVGGALIKGVSAIKAVEAIGPNAVTKISNTIKTAVSMVDNVERQLKETYIGRKALEAIDTLSTNIVSGTINQSNVHIFQNPDLVKGLVNLKSPILNGSIGAFADVADGYAYINPIQSSPFPTNIGSSLSASDGSWEYPSAGAELADTKNNQYTPKYKFQFIVDIQLAPELDGSVATAQKNFTFLATEIDRPTFKYAMEELNSYNFRFSVAKKMTFDPVTVTMLDDNANYGMRLMMSVAKSISPILNTNQVSVDIESTNGMDFTKQQAYYEKNNNAYVASVGPVQGADLWLNNQTSDTTSPIASITIYHLYDKSGFVNLYQYINPKITELDFDKVTMTDASGQVNEIKFSFVYDWVNVTDSVSAVEHQQSIERSISNAKLLVDGSSVSAPSMASQSNQYQTQQSPLGNSPLANQSLVTPIIPKITQNIIGRDINTGVSSVTQLFGGLSWKTPSASDNLSDWINDVET